MPILHIFFAILVAALWGGNFVAARTGIAEVPPLLLTAIRFAITAAILLPCVGSPGLSRLKHIALLSLTLGVLHFSLLFVAIGQGLDIASCAVAAEMCVPFSCLLGSYILKDRLGPWRSFGMLISFAGIFVLSGNPNVLAHPLGFAIALCGAFFWGVANIQIKQMPDVPTFQLLGWMALFAVPMLLVASMVIEGNPLDHVQHLTWRVPLALTYTVLGSTFAGYGLWSFLIQQYPLSQVTPYALLTPIFAIAAGELFFHTGITWQVWAGAALTIGGVAVIVIRRPKFAPLGEAV